VQLHSQSNAKQTRAFKPTRECKAEFLFKFSATDFPSSSSPLTEVVSFQRIRIGLLIAIFDAVG
jgi:hypothetical protein